MPAPTSSGALTPYPDMYVPLLPGGTRAADIPPEVVNLAEALSKRHGDVLVIRESGGHHIYCASPICLEQDGIREMS